ncbi:glycoside hydrolase family 88 protein [Micromonospora sp. DT81.3]|uniref:glycoside hydrolase family 88 protein n=1 Tax=Micromonospora sp. DT81.3 TaxID=3416523 RepID=UPI003CEBDFE0
MTERLRTAADALLTLPFEAWHFGDSIAFEAMVAASEALGDTRYRDFAHGFSRGWAAARPEFRPLDCTAAGAAMCRIVEETGDDLLRRHLVALGVYLTERPTIDGVYQTWTRSPLRESYGPVPLANWERELLADPGPGVFVDCLHFDPPFFARLSRITGDSRWLDEAVAQARGYIRLLQDAEGGLFHHFVLERTGTAHILGWARGQGWALLGLLEVIEELPDGDDRSELAASARRLIHAMVRAQRPDGHWDAVAQRREGGVETSTAAFLVAGFARAVRLDVIPAEEVGEALERSFAATVSSMGADGTLEGVSAAVWASTSIGHYDHVPRGFTVPWGQGPAVLAVIEHAQWSQEGARA